MVTLPTPLQCDRYDHSRPIPGARDCLSVPKMPRERLMILGGPSGLPLDLDQILVGRVIFAKAVRGVCGKTPMLFSRASLGAAEHRPGGETLNRCTSCASRSCVVFGVVPSEGQEVVSMGQEAKSMGWGSNLVSLQS